MEIKKNKIYLGDCMDLMEKWISLRTNWFKFQLCITDIPYAVDYQDKSTNLELLGKARDKQIERDKHFVTFPEDFNYKKFCQYLYLLMDLDSHTYIFCGEKQVPILMKEMEETNFKFNQFLIWVKNKSTFDMSFGLRYMYRHEFCLFFRKGNKKLNFPDNTLLKYNTGTSLEHPTIKPLEMFMRLVKNSSNAGDLVFDSFIGSGTTAVASKLLGRNYVGIEISKYFHDLTLKRLKTESVEKQVKLQT